MPKTRQKVIHNLSLKLREEINSNSSKIDTYKTTKVYFTYVRTTENLIPQVLKFSSLFCFLTKEIKLDAFLMKNSPRHQGIQKVI